MDPVRRSDRPPRRSASDATLAPAGLRVPKKHAAGLLEAIFNNAPSGVAVVDRAGQVIAANKALADMTGWDSSEMLDRPWRRMLHRADWALDTELTRHALLVGGPVPASEARLVRSDGTVVWVLMGVATVVNTKPRSRSTDRGARPLYLLRLVTDISEQKQVEAELAARAGRDPLTGLANRSLLLEHLRLSIRALAREPGVVAVLFFDLDRFKVVNDSLGHAAGDILLQGVADRLVDVFRPEDLVARLGGDEFVVTVDASAAADEDGRAREVIAAAERIQDALRAPFQADSRELVTSASIGIAATADSNADPTVMLRDADTAMYVVKQRGGSDYEMFDDRLRIAVMNRLELEHDLRDAITRGTPTVAYQPIVNLDDGALIAAEALIRWQHPHKGLLLPDAFIPLAEETGLIRAVDELVLHRACVQAAAWFNRFGDLAPTVRVNLSARDLTVPDLAERVVELLDFAGLPAERLCFEITETTLVADLGSAATALTRLHDRGVKVAIDDFGTRYASLSYITQLPIDMIKIDREFVREVDTNRQSDAVVGAITSLARTLNLRVTAEGVETQSQCDTLRRLGCDHGQGYLWGRPDAPESIDRMLVSTSR